MSQPSLQEIIGCLGHPMAGNPTQFIMERAFCNAGVDARCLTLDVAPDQLAAAIGGMRAMDFRGGIIAAPHNEPVCQLLDGLTPAAEFLGRADSIFRDEEGRFVGDHTLGDAVVKAAGVDWTGKTAVVCGTESEARLIGRALVATELAKIIIAGTAAAAGESLVERLREFAKPEVEFERTSHNVEFEPRGDIVIRAEPLNPLPEHEPDPLPLPGHFQSTTVVIDLPYRVPRTEFLKLAAQTDCRIVDGVDVVCCRANLAFFRWTGNEAEASALRDAVEEFFMI